MWVFFVLFGLVGLAAAGSQAKPGTKPQDVLPPGWSGPPKGPPSRVKASSGQLYDVMTWPPNKQDLQYIVAVAVGKANVWIGFIHDRKTAEWPNIGQKRKMFRASANGEAELQKLKNDFGVT